MVRRILFAAGVALAVVSAGLVQAQDRFLTVASTTSTKNSGLYDYLLPMFAEETGIEVRVVAVGTGKAIQQAQDGDADVLLVHAKGREEKFVEEGWGVERFDLMYNDFVIVGPSEDPAGIAGGSDAPAALAAIAEAGANFASRGDDSGTNIKELALWDKTGIDPKAHSGEWYQETGSGMGATLNTAVGLGAYALTDRATWIAFENKADFEILVEGDELLFNQYGVILVNPENYPHVKAEDGQAFIDWLLSDEGQEAIGAYTLDGQQLFFPNARPAGS